MPPLIRTAAVALVIAVAGCRGIWPMGGYSEPDWVEQPSSPAEEGRFVTATAVAGPGDNAEAVIEEADKAARAHLGTAVAEYTKRTIAEFLDQDANLPASDSPLSQDFMAVLASEVSASIVRRATRQDTWQTSNGRAYVLYRVPLGVVHGEIVSRSAYILERVNPFGQSTGTPMAALEQFLERQLNERLKVAAVERPVLPETPPEDLTPRWLQRGRHENYPLAGFFTTIGLGPGMAQAEASARRELATRLTQDARQLVTGIRSRPDDSALYRNAAALDPADLSFTDADVAPARVVERWYDAVTDTHYAFAVLDRSAEARQFSQQVADLRGTAGDMLTVARDHVRAGNTVAAIRRYLAALETAKQATADQIKAMTVGPLDDQIALRSLLKDPILPEAQRGVTVLLRSLAVEKLAGDHQWILPGVPPGEPFRVRVTVGEDKQPAADVPMRLVFGPGPAQAVGGKTDADGEAEWRITRPLPLNPDGRNRLRVEVALAELAGSDDVLGLPAPGADFVYLPRSAEHAQLVLHVREKTAGGRLVTTPLTGRLRDALREAGYKVLDESEVPLQVRTADISLDWTDDQILEPFAPLLARDGTARGFTLVIVGQVEALISETLEVDGGNLCIAHCPFEFRVIDGGLPEGKRTVLTVRGKGAGAYLEDQLEALRRARAEAAEEATVLLLKGLRGRLKPEWAAAADDAGA